MGFGLKLSFGWKVLLFLVIVGAVLWFALDWRARQKRKQILAARSAASSINFAMRPLSSAEYFARRQQLTDDGQSSQ